MCRRLLTCPGSLSHALKARFETQDPWYVDQAFRKATAIRFRGSLFGFFQIPLPLCLRSISHSTVQLTPPGSRQQIPRRIRHALRLDLDDRYWQRALRHERSAASCLSFSHEFRATPLIGRQLWELIVFAYCVGTELCILRAEKLGRQGTAVTSSGPRGSKVVNQIAVPSCRIRLAPPMVPLCHSIPRTNGVNEWQTPIICVIAALTNTNRANKRWTSVVGSDRCAGSPVFF